MRTSAAQPTFDGFNRIPIVVLDDIYMYVYLHIYLSYFYVLISQQTVATSTQTCTHIVTGNRKFIK